MDETRKSVNFTIIPEDEPWIRAVPRSSPSWPSVSTSSASSVAVLSLEIQPPPPRPACVMFRSSKMSAAVCPALTCSKPHFFFKFSSIAASSCIARPCDANAVE